MNSTECHKCKTFCFYDRVLLDKTKSSERFSNMFWTSSKQERLFTFFLYWLNRNWQIVSYWVHLSSDSALQPAAQCWVEKAQSYPLCSNWQGGVEQLRHDVFSSFLHSHLSVQRASRCRNAKNLLRKINIRLKQLMSVDKFYDFKIATLCFPTTLSTFFDLTVWRISLANLQFSACWFWHSHVKPWISSVHKSYLKKIIKTGSWKCPR